MKFVIGDIYFLVGYFDNALTIPDVSTYVFVGKDVLGEEGHSPRWYFQAAESYIKDGCFLDVPKGQERGILSADEVTLESIYDFDQLLVELNRAVGRRA